MNFVNFVNFIVLILQVIRSIISYTTKKQPLGIGSVDFIRFQAHTEYI